MSSTRLRGKQILDGDIMRDDLNVTLAGQAVTRKILAGTNIGISYTGADVGTGDVTVNLTGTVGVANGGTGATSLTGILVGNGTSAVSAIVGTANQLLRRNAGNTAYEFFTPNFETAFTKGSISIGTGITTTGTLTSRLVNAGDINIAFDQVYGDARYMFNRGSLAAVSINSNLATGTYLTQSTSPTTGTFPAGVTVNNGHVLVVRKAFDTNAVHQMMHINTGELATRFSGDNAVTWGTWRKIWDSVNLPSPASITTGTVNVLPKYTSASGLGPSNISDNGTLISTGLSARVAIGSGTDDFLNALQVTGRGRFSDGIYLGGSANNARIIPFASNNIGILSGLALSATDNIDISLGTFGGSITATSGARVNIGISQGFAPTSGTAAFTLLGVSPVINQTGGANGITRGIRITPTLTSASDWRSIEWTNNSGWGLYGAGTANNYLNGRTLFGTTTDNGTDRVQVNGSGLFTGNLVTSSTTASTSPTTGALRSAGGLGVAGAGFFGAGITATTGTFSSIVRVNGSTGSDALNIAGNVRLDGVANRIFRMGSSTNYNYSFRTSGDDFQLWEAEVGARMVVRFPTGNIGMGTTTPHLSAKLDLTSTTQGFLPPRMTQAQRVAIASPAEGLVVVQTDSVTSHPSGLYIYINAAWRALAMVTTPI